MANVREEVSDAVTDYIQKLDDDALREIRNEVRSAIRSRLRSALENKDDNDVKRSVVAKVDDIISGLASVKLTQALIREIQANYKDAVRAYLRSLINTLAEQKALHIFEKMKEEGTIK